MYDSKDMLVKNPISDITNPYLTPPIKMNVSGQDVILVKCTIRQVQKQEI